MQVVVPLVCITCLWCYLYEKGKNLLHNLKSWLKVTSSVIFGNEWIYTLYGINTAHIKSQVFGDGNMLWYLSLDILCSQIVMIVCSSKRNEMPWPLLMLDLPLPLLVFAWSSWVKELTFAFCTVDIATIAIKYFEAKSFDEHLLPTRLNHKFLAPSQMSSLLQVI